MMDDLDRGKIDIALLWGPIAGYYAIKAKTPTAVVPLLKEHGGPHMAYRIVMGVRHSDENWKRDLNKLISENQGEIQTILHSYGVPLLDETTSRSRADAWLGRAESECPGGRRILTQNRLGREPLQSDESRRHRNRLPATWPKCSTPPDAICRFQLAPKRGAGGHRTFWTERAISPMRCSIRVGASQT